MTYLTINDLLVWLHGTQLDYGGDLPIWLRSYGRGYTGIDDAPLAATLLTQDQVDHTYAVVLASAEQGEGRRRKEEGEDLASSSIHHSSFTLHPFRYALGAQVRLVGLPHVYTITFRRTTEGDLWPFAEYLVRRPEDVQRPPQWVYESECLPLEARMKDEG